MQGHPKDQTLPDVQKCVRFLKDLEVTWNGASKSRAIIEKLLRDSVSESSAVSKTASAVFEESEAFLWHQAPGSELFTYDVSGTDLFEAWLP
jgi:hypothetical protein